LARVGGGDPVVDGGDLGGVVLALLVQVADDGQEKTCVVGAVDVGGPVTNEGPISTGLAPVVGDLGGGHLRGVARRRRR
jgi:hypothetical protein